MAATVEPRTLLVSALREQLGHPHRIPVIIDPQPEWVASTVVEKRRTELLDQIETWRRDWESADPDRLLRHYSESEFRTGDQSFAGFAAFWIWALFFASKEAVNRIGDRAWFSPRWREAWFRGDTSLGASSFGTSARGIGRPS